MIEPIDLNSAILFHDAPTVLLGLQDPPPQETLDMAVICAIAFGRYEYIELLISKGANPDVRLDPVERDELDVRPPLTPEEEAEREVRFREMLRERGIEPPPPPPQDEFSKYARTLEMPGVHLGRTGEEATVLGYASSGSFRVVDMRLLRGEFEFGPERLPVWLARAQLIHLELVKRLLACGADVNATDAAGLTPLMNAIWGFTHGPRIIVGPKNDDCEFLGMLNPVPVMEQLIDAGADLDIQEPNGHTALMMWCHRCYAMEPHEHMGGLRLLLDGGCDVNLRSNTGRTALLNVSASRMVPIVRALLGAGADPTIPCRHGFSPLHHVVRFGDGDDESRRLEWLGTIRLLLDAGAAVDALGPKARTPLHMAAGQGVRPEVVKALLRAGANAGQEDELGLTPHALAVQRGHEALIPLLVAGSG